MNIRLLTVAPVLSANDVPFTELTTILNADEISFPLAAIRPLIMHVIRKMIISY